MNSLNQLTINNSCDKTIRHMPILDDGGILCRHCDTKVHDYSQLSRGQLMRRLRIDSVKCAKIKTRHLHNHKVKNRVANTLENIFFSIKLPRLAHLFVSLIFLGACHRHHTTVEYVSCDTQPKKSKGMTLIGGTKPLKTPNNVPKFKN